MWGKILKTQMPTFCPRWSGVGPRHPIFKSWLGDLVCGQVSELLSWPCEYSAFWMVFESGSQTHCSENMMFNFPSFSTLNIFGQSRELGRAELSVAPVGLFLSLLGGLSSLSSRCFKGLSKAGERNQCCMKAERPPWKILGPSHWCQRDLKWTEVELST